MAGVDPGRLCRLPVLDGAASGSARERALHSGRVGRDMLAGNVRSSIHALISWAVEGPLRRMPRGLTSRPHPAARLLRKRAALLLLLLPPRHGRQGLVRLAAPAPRPRPGVQGRRRAEPHLAPGPPGLAEQEMAGWRPSSPYVAVFAHNAPRGRGGRADDLGQTTFTAGLGHPGRRDVPAGDGPGRDGHPGGIPLLRVRVSAADAARRRPDHFTLTTRRGARRNASRCRAASFAGGRTSGRDPVSFSTSTVRRRAQSCAYEYGALAHAQLRDSARARSSPSYSHPVAVHTTTSPQLDVGKPEPRDGDPPPTQPRFNPAMCITQRSSLTCGRTAQAISYQQTHIRFRFQRVRVYKKRINTDSEQEWGVLIHRYTGGGACRVRTNGPGTGWSCICRRTKAE
ncbi:hypothetical protein BD413DRAFT_77976 [Trametes elegans]|nr:hypothetical protein BD413DRAFT_77976 [Trametes elegans]